MSSPPRRLLWIHQNFVSRGQAGNSRAVFLLSALMERDWQVDLIASQSSYLEKHAAEAGGDPREADSASAPTSGSTLDSTSTVDEEGGLRLQRLGARAAAHDFNRRGASYLGFTMRAIRVALKRPRADLVFTSSPPLPQVLPALLLSIWHRVPLVFEIRDLWPAMLVEAGLIRSPLADWLLCWVEATLARYASLCVPVTPGFAHYIERLGIPRKQIWVAPTGAHMALADCSAEAAGNWRSNLGLTDEMVILYAGSMQDHYGIRQILRAAEICEETAPEKPIVWVFAGGGREQGEVEKARDGRSNIRFLGAVAKEELTPAFHGADVGLVSLSPFPIFRAILPGKLFDYMAAGLPILSNAKGHAASIVRSSGAGLQCEPTEANDESLAQSLATGALGLAGHSKAERAAMGEAGQQYALENLDAARFARELEHEIRRVVEAGRASSATGRPGLLRFLRSALGGLVDVISGRSKAARETLAAPDALREIDAAWLGWIQSRPAVSSAPPLVVPEILAQGPKRR